MAELSFQPDQPLAPASFTPQQLHSIKAQIDLVLMAIECLTGLGSEAVLASAARLGLVDLINDRVNLWRLRQASPLRRGQGRKKLDIDEARALVLVSCDLAASHSTTIRSAVAALEQALDQGRVVHQVDILGNYLDAFTNAYQDRMEVDSTAFTDDLSALALKLLVDLVFYSGVQGSRKFWLTLLDRSGG
ncbi:MAG: DUF3038 domain-containing protein [Cyanobacteria bacterium REEB459]|nr:DUF3038 domain-containing protein [Cyanobacteria bacterium REEB459]